MNCHNCNKSVSHIIRTNPKGEIGVFWCEKCLKNKEPELFDNYKQEDKQVMDAIISALQ